MVADDRPHEVQDDELPDSGELALDSTEDDRLPWLESDDDDDDEGSDGGRMLGFATLALLLLAALIGGIWWLSRLKPDSTLVADGSTIAAPKTPYKEAPKDAGGKTFEGTGDTAFAVSQGKPIETGPATTAPEATGSAHPGITIPPPSSSGASSPAPAAGTPGTMVQIGAYKDRSTAEAAWTRVSGHYSALSGQHHIVAEGQADIGTVFRLQVAAGSGDGARSLCGKLKSQGLDCQVK